VPRVLNSELRSWTDGLLSVCSASLGWLFCSRSFAPLIHWSLLWHRIFRCWFRVDEISDAQCKFTTGI